METYRGSITDKYHIKRSMGKGATAEVYKAEEIASGRPVALKMYKPDHPAQEQLHEAEMLGQIIGCPNTIQLVEFVPFADTPYLATSFHEGATLKKELTTNGTMSPYEGTQILSNIATGMSAVHQRDIVHSDIKPENIIVGTDNHPTIVDFGYASTVKNGNARYRGGIFGTPAYASPEQMNGICCPRQDIYATGIVGYEVFTGKNPFLRSTDVLSAQRKRTSTPPSFESLLGGNMDKALDPLEGVIQKAVEKNPTKRYIDMDEFRDALQEGLSKSLQITAKDLVVIG